MDRHKEKSNLTLNSKSQQQVSQKYMITSENISQVPVPKRLFEYAEDPLSSDIDKNILMGNGPQNNLMEKEAKPITENNMENYESTQTVRVGEPQPLSKQHDINNDTKNIRKFDLDTAKGDEGVENQLQQIQIATSLGEKQKASDKQYLTTSEQQKRECVLQIPQKGDKTSNNFTSSRISGLSQGAAHPSLHHVMAQDGSGQSTHGWCQMLRATGGTTTTEGRESLVVVRQISLQPSNSASSHFNHKMRAYQQTINECQGAQYQMVAEKQHFLDNLSDKNQQKLVYLDEDGCDSSAEGQQLKMSSDHQDQFDARALCPSLAPKIQLQSSLEKVFEPSVEVVCGENRESISGQGVIMQGSSGKDHKRQLLGEQTHEIYSFNNYKRELMISGRCCHLGDRHSQYTGSDRQLHNSSLKDQNIISNNTFENQKEISQFHQETITVPLPYKLPSTISPSTGSPPAAAPQQEHSPVVPPLLLQHQQTSSSPDGSQPRRSQPFQHHHHQCHQSSIFGIKGANEGHGHSLSAESQNIIVSACKCCRHCCCEQQINEIRKFTSSNSVSGLAQPAVEDGGQPRGCQVCVSARKGCLRRRGYCKEQLENSCVTFQYYNSSKFASNSTTNQANGTGQNILNCFYLTKTTNRTNQSDYQNILQGYNTKQTEEKESQNQLNGQGTSQQIQYYHSAQADTDAVNQPDLDARKQIPGHAHLVEASNNQGCEQSHQQNLHKHFCNSLPLGSQSQHHQQQSTDITCCKGSQQIDVDCDKNGAGGIYDESTGNALAIQSLATMTLNSGEENQPEIPPPRQMNQSNQCRHTRIQDLILQENQTSCSQNEEEEEEEEETDEDQGDNASLHSRKRNNYFFENLEDGTQVHIPCNTSESILRENEQAERSQIEEEDEYYEFNDQIKIQVNDSNAASEQAIAPNLNKYINSQPKPHNQDLQVPPISALPISVPYYDILQEYDVIHEQSSKDEQSKASFDSLQKYTIKGPSRVSLTSQQFGLQGSQEQVSRVVGDTGQQKDLPYDNYCNQQSILSLQQQMQKSQTMPHNQHPQIPKYCHKTTGKNPDTNILGDNQGIESVKGAQSEKNLYYESQKEYQRVFCTNGERESSQNRTPDSEDQSYTILQMASSTQKMAGCQINSNFGQKQFYMSLKSAGGADEASEMNNNLGTIHNYGQLGNHLSIKKGGKVGIEKVQEAETSIAFQMTQKQHQFNLSAYQACISEEIGQDNQLQNEDCVQNLKQITIAHTSKPYGQLGLAGDLHSNSDEKQYVDDYISNGNVNTTIKQDPASKCKLLNILDTTEPQESSLIDNKLKKIKSCPAQTIRPGQKQSKKFSRPLKVDNHWKPTHTSGTQNNDLPISKDSLNGVQGVDSALLNSLLTNLNQLNALCKSESPKESSPTSPKDAVAQAASMPADQQPVVQNDQNQSEYQMTQAPELFLEDSTKVFKSEAIVQNVDNSIKVNQNDSQYQTFNWQHVAKKQDQVLYDSEQWRDFQEQFIKKSQDCPKIPSCSLKYSSDAVPNNQIKQKNDQIEPDLTFITEKLADQDFEEQIEYINQIALRKTRQQPIIIESHINTNKRFKTYRPYHSSQQLLYDVKEDQPKGQGKRDLKQRLGLENDMNLLNEHQVKYFNTEEDQAKDLNWRERHAQEGGLVLINENGEEADVGEVSPQLMRSKTEIISLRQQNSNPEPLDQATINSQASLNAPVNPSSSSTTKWQKQFVAATSRSELKKSSQGNQRSQRRTNSKHETEIEVRDPTGEQSAQATQKENPDYQLPISQLNFDKSQQIQAEIQQIPPIVGPVVPEEKSQDGLKIAKQPSQSKQQCMIQIVKVQRLIPQNQSKKRNSVRQMTATTTTSGGHGSGPVPHLTAIPKSARTGSRGMPGALKKEGTAWSGSLRNTQRHCQTSSTSLGAGIGHDNHQQRGNGGKSERTTYSNMQSLSHRHSTKELSSQIDHSIQQLNSICINIESYDGASSTPSHAAHPKRAQGKISGREPVGEGVRGRDVKKRDVANRQPY